MCAFAGAASFRAMSETLAEHLRKFDAACQSSTDAATRQAAEAYLLDFRSKPFAQEVALKVRHSNGQYLDAFLSF